MVVYLHHRFFRFFPVLLVLICLQGIASDDSEWIDPDTADEHRTITRNDGTGPAYDLVFSDEFNSAGREFGAGEDPRWTALDKPDSVNSPLAYYTPSMVTTKDGKMTIKTTNQEPVSWQGWDEQNKVWTTFTRWYKSGMVQSWNKFCFTGGIIEIDLKLPGPGNMSGLWPAAWLMGNLGRATWQETTNGLWPWSFDQCVEEESPNVAAAQSINACNDKPNFGLHPHQGRGAPEIDIFEAMATEAFSGMTQSLQVAPALPKTFRPNIGQTPAKGMWYDGIEFSNGAVNNDAYYGPEGADAVSANIGTDVSFYSTFHTFRVEWELGEEGYIRWFVDDKKFFEIPASALSKQYGDLPGRRIPEEPMYLILNTAVSSNWSPVCGKQWDASQQCPPGSTKECCRIFPAEYQVDSVRIYQSKEMGHRLGCSPKEFPTAEYIQAHAKMYDAEDISTFPSINGREKLLRDTLASIMCLMLIATIVYHSAAHCRQKYKRWAYVPIDHSSHSEACTGSAYAGGGGRRSGGSDREQSAVLVGLEEGGTDVSVRHRQGHEHLNLYGLPQYRGVEIDWQLASEHKIN